MSATEPKLKNKSAPGGLMSHILREPLVHFLAMAGVLFLIQALFATDERDIIVVDAQTQKFLFKQEEELQLRPLTEEEKADIVSNFIEEEILVREAVKRGFSDSSRIRALLLQNMRFFIAGDISEPSEDELRAYFQANQDIFESPPSVDFDHVMYEAGNTVPAGVLDQLRAGVDPTTLGDADLSFGRSIRFMTQTRIAQAFGPDAALDVIAASADSDDWHGPFMTPSGSTHFLRVIQRHPKRLPDFETARDWISTRWLADQSRAMLDQEIEAVAPDYKIEVEPVQEDVPGA
ncbi:peptidyl-prolyl cis-trans isomerase [Tropicibacter sp. R16_0]|uniref:peptidylprolyl isomerase n=1 Tax=Tropicibacter sp. R16_0 TaxID=2821102 RepID=UPI001ADB0C70|nr:peptidylprolyl isomerase [Tropicibacter sp. R16_0]MBO9449916.1 peptidyl-prolyl cis-trans isomerase [Tropicibacter sp. R16_0]